MAEPSFTPDEYAEATTALEDVVVHLREAAEDAHQWKWVVTALHSALQSVLVLALRSSPAPARRPITRPPLASRFA